MGGLSTSYACPADSQRSHWSAFAAPGSLARLRPCRASPPPGGGPCSLPRVSGAARACRPVGAAVAARISSSELARHSPTFEQTVLIALESEPAQAKRGARKPHSVTAFETLPVRNWLRRRRQTLQPALLTSRLFCTFCIASSLSRGIEQDETILPFPGPMLTTECLRPRGDGRTADKVQTSAYGRRRCLQESPPVGQRLKCPLPCRPSIRGCPPLDARLRLNASARLSTHAALNSKFA